MYEGAAETWTEWGRSLDLKDASSPAQKWGDLGFLIAVQGFPLPMTLLLSEWVIAGHPLPMVLAALGLNLFLMITRIALLGGIVSSYDRSASLAFWTFWLSPLADPLAILRIFLSSIRTPRKWRGRVYY